MIDPYKCRKMGSRTVTGPFWCRIYAIPGGSFSRNNIVKQAHVPGPSACTLYGRVLHVYVNARATFCKYELSHSTLKNWISPSFVPRDGSLGTRPLDAMASLATVANVNLESCYEDASCEASKSKSFRVFEKSATSIPEYFFSIVSKESKD